MTRFLILQDYKENRAKCTVEPLRGHGSCEFVRFRKPRTGEPAFSVPPGLLLDVGAPTLSRDDASAFESGGELGSDGVVIVLDATWARLRPLQNRLSYSDRTLRRSLPSEFVTAYPRVSKLFEDPAAGLATVEAMYLVSVILGCAHEDFLETYRWADEFRQRNAEELAAWAG